MWIPSKTSGLCNNTKSLNNDICLKFSPIKTNLLKLKSEECFKVRWLPSVKRLNTKTTVQPSSGLTVRAGRAWGTARRNPPPLLSAPLLAPETSLPDWEPGQTPSDWLWDPGSSAPPGSAPHLQEKYWRKSSLAREISLLHAS